MTRPMPELEGVSHELYNVGGIRMHVAVAGDPASEPLVLIHGWPQHWWVWRKLIGPLSDRYRVICPDLRGFGWSEAPSRSYLKADLADDVVALADALELDRFKLAGHDWGGLVGFHVCLKQPARVSHYAAAGISHLWVRADDATLPERIRLLGRLWYQFVLASPLLGRQVVQRLPMFMRTVLNKGADRPDTFTDADIETFVSQWAEPERARASVQVYRSFLTREFAQIAKGAFDDRVLEQPIAMLIGEGDPVISAEDLEGAEANLPNLELRELTGVGHFVPEEAPDVMLAAMNELFER
ncbi:MAG TPA: alpha/beta fold hydrolase [Solirubrobacterales bacterium]|nr:alpha/beta fold hydrolase [Solirubrobacterales bacterium]